MALIWLPMIGAVLLCSWWQFTAIHREHTLSALADGICPRCRGGELAWRCRACDGTGSAQGFEAAGGR